MMMKSFVGAFVISVICLATKVSAGPADISGLRLWLDAGQNVTKDGSNNVSAWGDITDVANNTVAQNVEESNAAKQPLWVDNAMGGQPAIRFDGLDDGLSNAADNLLGSGTDRTIFIVGQASAADAAADGLGGTLVSIRRGASTPPDRPFFAAQIYDVAGWNGFDEACCGTADPSALYTDGLAINHVVANSVFPISNINQPFLSEHRVESLLLSFDFNGVNVPIKRLFNNAAPIVAAETSVNLGFMIGERSDKDNQRWQGDIAEVLIYERALSLSETQAINSYVSQKYGIGVVPEPNTLVLGLVAVVGMLFGHRKESARIALRA
jgi:hypothetical protein